MNARRKTAATVFMEQNVVQRAEANDQDVAEAPALGLAAPGAPAPQQAYGGYPAPPPPARKPPPADGLKTSEELQLEKEPLRVRETGFWPFKRVLVPPNAYVVHTRIGRKAAVTLGLGLSFRYNPNTDAYLIVPAAMQTIGIVANSISKEKQGINILAYVQWQINDFSIAYRKLDFSDSRDPLGIVNAQLREQAEAAIKDKIATMSVEEVLTDKQPVIEELTSRLKAVAEGRTDDGDDEGLGIKIVTVQIKEALVSSQRLWEHLQAPFRYEQEKTARISHLLAQDEIRQKELQNRQSAETSEAETLVEIERIKQSKETEALEIRVIQQSTRFTREQESLREKLQLEEQTTRIRQESELRLQAERDAADQAVKLAALRRSQEEALERSRLDAEASIRQKALQVNRALEELAEETRLAEQQLQADQERLARETTRKRLEAEFAALVQEQEARLKQEIQQAALLYQREEARARLELEQAASAARLSLREREVGIERLVQENRNLVNERDLSGRLIEALPDLAAHMPAVHELKVLQTGNGDGAFDPLAQFLARMVALADSLGLPLRPRGE
ncbi:MAG TPA: SPFH domain-containing protein [Herpetosiphonaceae bacterium]|nr:SPFH domain-containing protein [Herpetosiphonaceae bacterium]